MMLLQILFLLFLPFFSPDPPPLLVTQYLQFQTFRPDVSPFKQLVGGLFFLFTKLLKKEREPAVSETPLTPFFKAKYKYVCSRSVKTNFCAEENWGKLINKRFQQVTGEVAPIPQFRS
jgi:hypothetical protein